MPTWEAWQGDDGLQITLAQPEEAVDMQRRGLLGENPQLLYRFDAATHEEAQAIHHLRMGWEPYKPLGKAAECPKCGALRYPEDSGLCWQCGFQS